MVTRTYTHVMRVLLGTAVIVAAADGESCRPVGSHRRRVHVQVRFIKPSYNNIQCVQL